MNIINSASSSVVRKLSVALGVLLVCSAPAMANPENTEELTGTQVETPVLADIEINWTYPPSGYICPRIEEADGSRPPQLDELFISFSDPIQLTQSMITVQSTGDLQPTVVQIVPDVMGQTEWSIILDQPVPLGRSVSVTVGTDQVVMLHAVPGDVNQDGIVSYADLVEFDEAFTDNVVADPLYFDLNADGAMDEYDRDLLVERVVEVEELDLTPTAYAICCETYGVCQLFLVGEGDDCPGGWEEVTCPCMLEKPIEY